MIRVKLIFYLLIVAINANSTVQVPDLLIIKSDTFAIDYFPLDNYESFNDFKPQDFGIENCMSTACWREYQAIWELIDSKLYLIAIHSCCNFSAKTHHLINDSISNILIKQGVPKDLLLSIENSDGYYSGFSLSRQLKMNISDEDISKYKDLILSGSEISRPRVDLEKLFGDKCIDRRVFAFWYNADISEYSNDYIYSSDSIASKASWEVILEFEAGVLIDSIIHENKFQVIDTNFKRAYGENYVYVVPSILNTPEAPLDVELYDTLYYTNLDESFKTESFLVSYPQWLINEKQIDIVDSTLKSYTARLEISFNFDNITTKKTRYGNTGWIDGYDTKTNTYIRISSLVNRYNQLVMIYSSTDQKNISFILDANYISNSFRINKNCLY